MRTMNLQDYAADKFTPDDGSTANEREAEYEEKERRRAARRAKEAEREGRR